MMFSYKILRESMDPISYEWEMLDFRVGSPKMGPSPMIHDPT